MTTSTCGQDTNAQTDPLSASPTKPMLSEVPLGDAVEEPRGDVVSLDAESSVIGPLSDRAQVDEEEIVSPPFREEISQNTSITNTDMPESAPMLTSDESSPKSPFVEANCGELGEVTTDDDDDDMTIIVLDQTDDNNNHHVSNRQDALAWIEQAGPEMEERRRNVLIRELRRVQRASFIHFMLLCLIPTVLLFIVIATVIGEEEVCESEATICELEPRTFINAFTTRCVCDAIPVDRQN